MYNVSLNKIPKGLVIMKRILSISIVMSLIFILITVSFASVPVDGNITKHVENLLKDETVFASLNKDGTIKAVSVVNRIETFTNGIYTDYGRYSQIKNLTGKEEPKIDGAKLIWTLPASSKGFYYEGILNDAELPFIISLSYFLDGKSVDADYLLGKSGNVKIKIGIASNDKAAAYFKDSYLAQMQLPLSLEKCSNILAEGAQSVIVGSTNNLSFIVLPGSDKEFTVSFEAKNFEMAGITVTLTSADMIGMLGIDSKQIEAGTSGISEGAGKLASGTEQLRDGIAVLVNGLKKAVSGMSEILNGSGELKTGLESYTAGIENISGKGEVLSAGVSQLGEKGAELSNGFTQISDSTSLLLDGLLNSVPKEQQALFAGQIDLIKKQMQGYGSALNDYSKGVYGASQGISALADGLNQIASKSPELIKGITELDLGLKQFNQGLGALYEGSREVPAEVGKLVDGQKKLKQGLDDAMALFEDYKPDLGSKNKPVSFADESRTVRSVQFILKTPELKIREEKTAALAEEKPKSLWERIIGLFIKK